MRLAASATLLLVVAALCAAGGGCASARERDELRALVQRLKDLEMSMEQKRKRMR